MKLNLLGGKIKSNLSPLPAKSNLARDASPRLIDIRTQSSDVNKVAGDARLVLECLVTL